MSSLSLFVRAYCVTQRLIKKDPDLLVAQDRALSRRKERFEFAWGHLLHGYMHEESPLLVKNPIRLADCHGRLSIDHGINYLGSLRYLPAIGSAKLDTCVV